jgi:AraC-like DNA-binding protein
MLSDLAHAVERYTDAQNGQSPFETAIAGLTILRSNQEKRPNHLIFKPALCITVQGAKSAMFGHQRFEYGAGKALVVSVEMPGFGTVVEASPSEPFLGIILEFDITILRKVIDEMASPPAASLKVSKGVCVADFDGPLADCALRMVQLLDTPKAIPMLYPAIMREVCYWLLTGPQGGDVLTLTLANSHTQRMVAAIHTLRDRFAESVRIEELASIARMSPSAFHRQFKAITSMTPLQYQKQLRLLEARRLMVSEAANVETAAFQVGYESPSQFSREYSRMFAMSPRRDVVAFKGTAA